MSFSRRRFPLVLLLASACTSGPAPDPFAPAGRDRAPRTYLCYRATSPLRIDGRLDEGAWKVAPWTEAFVDIEGGSKPVPRFETRARMLWDDEFFFIGAFLVEPHVWGTIREHDAVIFEDNDFEVFLDPDGDSHQYFEIEINALGTEWDLRLVKPYKDGGPALNSWEIPGLQKSVHVRGTLNDPADRDVGWSLELAIPWRALSEFAGREVPPREGDRWRVNFSRVEWRQRVEDGVYRKVPGTREDNWVWSPQHAINMHLPEHWGYVQFTAKDPSEARFIADPALPARRYLQDLYRAQRVFHERHGRYAARVEELGLAAPRDEHLPAPATIALTPDGYVAALKLLMPGGGESTWHIRWDARIWGE